MKLEFKGEKLNIKIFGESHAEKIGAEVKGFPRLKVDFEKLENLLERRKPTNGVFSTLRNESDKPIFEKGLDNGVIDGDFKVVIYNKDVKSSDYNELYAKPRPSHADYTRYLKDGTLDYRGGGEYSARMTAPLCAIGALAKQYLQENFGVEILGYLSSVGKVTGKSYKDGGVTIEEIEKSHKSFLPALSNSVEMFETIGDERRKGNSVGASVECVVFNFPVGIGGSLFNGIEGKISSSIYAIPGVKGVEFGDGFDLCAMTGIDANDSLGFVNRQVKVLTNRAGGINGGISNGNPITMRVAFRPTPSIALSQNTVDLEKGENTVINIKGRHDSCIAVRGIPVVESMVAIALLDIILKEKKDEND